MNDVFYLLLALYALCQGILVFIFICAAMICAIITNKYQNKHIYTESLRYNTDEDY